MLGPALAFALHASAASTPAPVGGVEAEAVQTYRERYRRTQLTGMSVLTGYALANIAWGLTGALTEDGVTQYVHEMNAAWNTVNLSLGIAGLVTNRKLEKIATREDARKLYRRTLKTYAINNGLDVLYIGSGTLLFGLGRDQSWQRVEGYGISIMIQGGFLFVYDLAMLIAHERTAANVPRLQLVPTVSPGSRTVGLTGRF